MTIYFYFDKDQTKNCQPTDNPLPQMSSPHDDVINTLFFCYFFWQRIRFVVLNKPMPDIAAAFSSESTVVFIKFTFLIYMYI